MKFRSILLNCLLIATTAAYALPTDQTATTAGAPMQFDTERQLSQFTPGRVGKWHAYVNKFRDHQTLLDHLIAASSEYVGTALFIFLAFTPVNFINRHVPDPASALVYNSLAFGFALTITARCFGNALMNPGVTIAMSLLNIVTPLRAIILGLAQYSGALTGAAVVQALTGPLQTLCRKSGLDVGQAFTLELLTSAAFIFHVLMVAAKPKKVNLLAAQEIGLGLFVCELVSIAHSGGSLNGARNLASDVVARDFVHYAWIYQVSNFAGGALAAGIYKFFEQIQQLSKDAPSDVDLGIGLAAKVTGTDANPVAAQSSGHAGGHVRHGSRAERMPVSPIGQIKPAHPPA